MLGGSQRRAHRAGVSGASTQMPGEGFPHFLLRGIGIVRQQFSQTHENPRRAESTLQSVMVLKCLLQGFEAGGDAQSLDRFQASAIHLNRECQAGSGRAALYQHGAGSADSVFTTKMCSGQADFMPKEVGQRHAGFDIAGVSLAVDVDGNRMGCCCHAVSLFFVFILDDAS